MLHLTDLLEMLASWTSGRDVISHKLPLPPGDKMPYSSASRLNWFTRRACSGHCNGREIEGGRERGRERETETERQRQTNRERQTERGKVC